VISFGLIYRAFRMVLTMVYRTKRQKLQTILVPCFRLPVHSSPDRSLNRNHTNTILPGCMQWEAGVFSLLVVFGGCGVSVEGRNMNLDSNFGSTTGVYSMDY